MTKVSAGVYGAVLYHVYLQDAKKHTWNVISMYTIEMSLSSVKLPCSADSHAFLPPLPPPPLARSMSQTFRLHHESVHLSYAFMLRNVCCTTGINILGLQFVPGPSWELFVSDGGMSQHIFKQSRSNRHVSREVMSKAAGFSWSYDGNRSIATTARVACLL